MNRDMILKEVNEIFWDVFDDEDIVISEKSSANDIEDWDSLEHINLIVAIEEKFSMKFTMGEVTGMNHVGDMIDILENRGTL